jgi:hypothetical protein
VPGGVVLVGAVAEVEPERVDPGLDERAEALGRGGRRAERGEDLGAALAEDGGGLLSEPDGYGGARAFPELDRSNRR